VAFGETNPIKILKKDGPAMLQACMMTTQTPPKSWMPKKHQSDTKARWGAINKKRKTTKNFQHKRI
jgi:hypothetical protein